MAAAMDAAGQREFIISPLDTARVHSPLADMRRAHRLPGPNASGERDIRKARKGGQLGDAIAGNCYSPYRAG
jgi:hypothetical protein